MNPDPRDLFRQKTLAREVSISGVGIHTGKEIHLRLLPASADAGIVFRRTDAGGVEIPAAAREVSSLELATTVGRNGITVSTIEHLLAALRIADIDNVIAEVSGPEVPILDGSALPFLRLLEAAGTRAQAAARRLIVVTAPVEVRDGNRMIRVSPYPGLRVRYSIDFPHPAIGQQTYELEIDRPSFERELAAARTFTLRRDVDYLLSRGLGLGGATDNCVVFEPSGVPNTPLRFADEPVRHKALDAVGDLSLLGAPLWGFVEVERGGHQLHHSLVEKLLARRDCWTWVQGLPRPERAIERIPRRAPVSRHEPEQVAAAS